MSRQRRRSLCGHHVVVPVGYMYCVYHAHIMRFVYYYIYYMYNTFLSFTVFIFFANNRLALYSRRRTCLAHTHTHTHIYIYIYTLDPIYIYHLYGVILCVRLHLYSIVYYIIIRRTTHRIPRALWETRVPRRKYYNKSV